MLRLFRLTDRGAKAASNVLPSGRNKILDALYAHKGKVGFSPVSLDTLSIETGIPENRLLVELRSLKRLGLVEELTNVP
jgi:DNA-binding transcriptional ArsR family regulator